MSRTSEAKGRVHRFLSRRRSVALLIQADFTSEEAIQKYEIADGEGDSEEPPYQAHAQAIAPVLALWIVRLYARSVLTGRRIGYVANTAPPSVYPIERY